VRSITAALRWRARVTIASVGCVASDRVELIVCRRTKEAERWLP
jgi:hypothetical protein